MSDELHALRAENAELRQRLSEAQHQLAVANADIAKLMAEQDAPYAIQCRALLQRVRDINGRYCADLISDIDAALAKNPAPAGADATAESQRGRAVETRPPLDRGEAGAVRKSETPEGGVGTQMPGPGSIPGAIHPDTPLTRKCRHCGQYMSGVTTEDACPMRPDRQRTMDRP